MEVDMRADTNYLSTEELARNWKLSEWTIRDHAKRGRISGAIKPGRDWRFPHDARLIQKQGSVGSTGMTREEAIAAIRRLR